MKANIDYSDPYRFLVSAGIVVIGMSLLLPWLLLQVSLDIVIRTDDLSQLTPAAQAIVNRRQTSALWLIENVSLISGVLAALGILCLLVGMLFWYRRYRQQEELELLKEQRERLDALRRMPSRYQSELETIRRELGIEQLEVDSTNSITENDRVNVQVLIPWWNMVTSSVSASLKRTFKDTHIVDPSLRLGEDNYILMRARQPRNPDVLIKLRPVLGPTESSWFGDTIAQSIFSQRFLEKERARSIILKVVFIPFVDSILLPDQEKESINDQIAPLMAEGAWDYVTSKSLADQGPEGYQWESSLFENRQLVKPLGQRARIAAIHNRSLTVRIGVSVAIVVALLVGIFQLFRWLSPISSTLAFSATALAIVSTLGVVSAVLYVRNTVLHGILEFRNVGGYGGYFEVAHFQLRGPKGKLQTDFLDVDDLRYHLIPGSLVEISYRETGESDNVVLTLAPFELTPISREHEVVYVPASVDARDKGHFQL